MMSVFNSLRYRRKVKTMIKSRSARTTGNQSKANPPGTNELNKRKNSPANEFFLTEKSYLLKTSLISKAIMLRPKAIIKASNKSGYPSLKVF